MKAFSILLISLLVLGATCFYDRFSAVKSFTASDFHQAKKGIWLVQFYAPWCGHCRSLAPEYEKAAKALQGIANIAAIDADKERTDVQIQGFPTIKFFNDGKMSDYDGPRTAQGIVDFMFRKLRNIANQKLGGGGSYSSGGSQGSGGSGDANEKDVIVLSDSNFEQSVYGDEFPWFVQFYAPWCGHCKSLAPEYAELATALKGQVKVAKVDATQHKEAAGRFGVRGYPTIKFFPGGKKDDGSAIDYDGPRTAAGMTEWALEKTKGLNNFEQVQLTSQDVYQQNCKGRGLCVITFLPNLLDSSDKQFADYFQKIKEVGLKFRGKPYKFIWAQGGDHFEFEEKIGAVGVGYPVVAVIYQSKKYFGKLRKSFSVENLENYLTDILANKVRMNKLLPFDDLKTVDAYVPPSVEEQEAGSSGQGCNQHQCAPPSEEKEQKSQDL